MRTDRGARTCFITNFIPPYRKTFYEKLSRALGGELVVVRGRVTAETGRPEHQGSISAKMVDVHNIERRCGSFTLRYQRGVLGAAMAANPRTVVVLGMVGNVTNWFVMMWAKLTGRKIVIWACGWEPQRPGSFQLRIKNVVSRLFYGFADRCLLYSSKGLEHLVGIGADRRRMEVCFNGIEIEPLIAGERQIAADAERIRERNAAQDAFVFLYVGGLLEEKRVDLLLEAFDAVRKKMPQIRLWIVGDGPDATRLKALAAGQIEVSFLGRIIDGVDQYFAAADAFVLPGIGGLAFNQAMFWRTPCISSVADGTEDDLVIDGVTGFRFEEGSRASLAAAMARAARTAPEDRRRMGESARRVVVERSNVDYMVAQFAKTLASLHDGSPPQGAVPDAGSKARFESNNEPV